MKRCADCRSFIKAKSFSNSNECCNPNFKGLLYIDVASECEYYSIQESLSEVF